MTDPRIVRILESLARTYLLQIVSVILVGTWFFFRQFRQRICAILGRNWAIAEGKVETVNVKTFQQNCLGEIGYSYIVENEFYSGYYSRQFIDEQTAWSYVDGLKDQPVVVLFKPGEPEVSGLRIEDQNGFFRGQTEPKSWLTYLFRLLGWRMPFSRA